MGGHLHPCFPHAAGGPVLGSLCGGQDNRRGLGGRGCTCGVGGRRGLSSGLALAVFRSGPEPGPALRPQKHQLSAGTGHVGQSLGSRAGSAGAGTAVPSGPPPSLDHWGLLTPGEEGPPPDPRLGEEGRSSQAEPGRQGNSTQKEKGSDGVLALLPETHGYLQSGATGRDRPLTGRPPPPRHSPIWLKPSFGAVVGTPAPPAPSPPTRPPPAPTQQGSAFTGMVRALGTLPLRWGAQ